MSVHDKHSIADMASMPYNTGDFLLLWPPGLPKLGYPVHILSISCPVSIGSATFLRMIASANAGDYIEGRCTPKMTTVSSLSTNSEPIFLEVEA